MSYRYNNGVHFNERLRYFHGQMDYECVYVCLLQIDFLMVYCFMADVVVVVFFKMYEIVIDIMISSSRLKDIKPII